MNKDKQIEEMARIVCSSFNGSCYNCPFDFYPPCPPKKGAERLYNAGYRKASDLEAEIADLNAIAEQYRKQFEEARTDVAREIFEEIEKFMSPYRYPIIADLKKKYTEDGE